ncbi:MAG: heavy-metal-associated domain-containing protein [Candidatus Rokubacteria bacterium]|nr:heavy-metal-associated domain-containing protein [Candidatus Rokubacteria bacterium]
MVERALAGLPGIKKAEVSFYESQARVVYDPAAVTLERIVEAINRTGFVARPLQGGEGKGAHAQP